MRFRLAPRSMTLDDLELYKFEFSENFAGFRRFRPQQQLYTNDDRPVLSATTLSARRIGAILACFRVARVCRRQLGFLVLLIVYSMCSFSILILLVGSFEL